MKKIEKLKITYFGLSHLGLVHSISTALKNFKITSFDFDKKKIQEFKKGNFNIDEPNIYKFYKKIKSNIKFTNDINDLVDSDIIYFSLDIRTNNKNISDLSELNNAIKNTIPFLHKKTLIVILSQVPPGFTNSINWPKDKLFYQVETLIFGDAFNRALYPERIIIGANQQKKLNVNLKNFLKKFTPNILLMKYEEAELTKISINLFLSSTISMTNIFSEYCEKNKLSWSKIIPALKLDKRIGKFSYLTPGLGISGGNLERDLMSFNKLLIQSKIDSNYIKEIIKFSQKRKSWVIEKFKRNKNKNIKTIGIFGLAYKENTHSIKNSPTIKLINYLSKFNFKIDIYDPLISSYKSFNILKKIDSKSSKYDCIIILNKSDYFHNLNKINLSNLKLLIDPYGVLKSSKNLNDKCKVFNFE